MSFEYSVSKSGLEANSDGVISVGLPQTGPAVPHCSVGSDGSVSAGIGSVVSVSVRKDESEISVETPTPIVSAGVQYTTGKPIQPYISVSLGPLNVKYLPSPEVCQKLLDTLCQVEGVCEPERLADYYTPQQHSQVYVGDIANTIYENLSCFIDRIDVHRQVVITDGRQQITLQPHVLETIQMIAHGQAFAKQTAFALQEVDKRTQLTSQALDLSSESISRAIMRVDEDLNKLVYLQIPSTDKFYPNLEEIFKPPGFTYGPDGSHHISGGGSRGGGFWILLPILSISLPISGGCSVM